MHTTALQTVKRRRRTLLPDILWAILSRKEETATIFDRECAEKVTRPAWMLHVPLKKGRIAENFGKWLCSALFSALSTYQKSTQGKILAMLTLWRLIVWERKKSGWWMLSKTSESEGDITDLLRGERSKSCSCDDSHMFRFLASSSLEESVRQKARSKKDKINCVIESRVFGGII